MRFRQMWPPLSDRGRGPRQRPAGVGCSGSGQGHLGEVLRCLGRRTLRADHPRQCGRRGLDQHRSGPAVPKHGALRRPFHVVKWAADALDEVRRQDWDHAHSAVTPASCQLGVRACQGAQTYPVRVVEEAREPHQPAAGQAGLARQGRHEAAPRPPVQGRSAAGLQLPLPGGRRRPRGLDRLGPAAATSRRSQPCHTAGHGSRARSSPTAHVVSGAQTIHK